MYTIRGSDYKSPRFTDYKDTKWLLVALIYFMIFKYKYDHAEIWGMK